MTHCHGTTPTRLLKLNKSFAEAKKKHSSHDDFKKGCHLRLSSFLVHSKRSQDVQRGIALLEGSTLSKFANDPKQEAEKLYLLAVGYHISGHYSKSMDLQEKFLMECEREVGDCGNLQSFNEVKKFFYFPLASALVHSKLPQDVQRGIEMLEVSLPGTHDPVLHREKLYLLAVGYFRSGSDYCHSRDLLDRCLMIEPSSRKALKLKRTIQDRINIKDSAVGLGMNIIGVLHHIATTVGALTLILAAYKGIKRT
ncbi:hypothetical protein RIF29_21934 [Crotalaria pallida]|uniref:Mitochondrial fission 1 protein n=1 Tax=Crotalaria pallida TaxID=3830 RepID=A0AAN9IDY0_CROPI